MKSKLTGFILLSLGFLTLSLGGSSGCGSSSSGLTYSVGGTITGLSGTVVLQNNAGDDLSVTTDGAFTFATELDDAADYSVTVLTQPSGQACTVVSGSGTISAADVTNVTVTCVSTDASLSALTISSLTLSPTFDAATTDYTASVNFLTTAVTVTPTAADSGATITVNTAAVTSGASSDEIALTAGINTLTVFVTAEDGTTTETYTITVTRADASALVEQAYLKASTPELDAEFGYGVAIAGDTMVVGSPYGATNGVIHIFTRSGTDWTEVATLQGTDTLAAGSDFGYSVGISEDESTIVVGDPEEVGMGSSGGVAYVFVGAGDTWTQQAKLVPSMGNEDSFGNSVGISGDTVVVGDNEEDGMGAASNSGAAYVFMRNGTTWTEEQYLQASNAGAGDNFGSVSISGDTIVVGAGYEDGDDLGAQNDSGAAYVFERNGTTWEQTDYLKADDAGAADNFGGDAYGMGVAISGDTIAVGAPNEDGDDLGSQNNSGAVYVFVRSGETWTQEAKLKATNVSNEQSGSQFAISGDSIVVGVTGENSIVNNNSGTAHVFMRDANGDWNEETVIFASNGGSSDEFSGGVGEGGPGIAISGDTIVIGAHQEDSSDVLFPDDDSLNDSGAVYVFQ